VTWVLIVILILAGWAESAAAYILGRRDGFRQGTAARCSLEHATTWKDPS
jgi:hypothetical protein